MLQAFLLRSIFTEHSREKGERLHHVSFNMNDSPCEERIKSFEQHDLKPAQTGTWLGAARFAFFDTEAAIGMGFKTYHYPNGHQKLEEGFTCFPESAEPKK